MARIAIDQETLLKKLVQRLRSEVAEFSESTCFWSLDPEPDVANDQNLWATLTLMDSVFGADEMEGGGENTCFEYGGFSVNVFSKVHLDQRGHAFIQLTDQTFGMMAIKQKILKALTGHDLVVNDDLDVALIGLVVPLNAPRPEPTGKQGVMVMTIHFSLDFNWDLS